jgi:hypothetical protein
LSASREESAVVLRTIPTSQNRDVGHPATVPKQREQQILRLRRRMTTKKQSQQQVLAWAKDDN